MRDFYDQFAGNPVQEKALFPASVIEQLARLGDGPLLIIDLKGDSSELISAMQTAADAARQSADVPIISNQLSLTARKHDA